MPRPANGRAACVTEDCYRLSGTSEPGGAFVWIVACEAFSPEARGKAPGRFPIGERRWIANQALVAGRSIEIARH